VSDIFREVEEDVRRERIEKIWKQYGDYIIAGAAIIVLAIAGWQFWKYYHGREIARASAAFTSASIKASNGDPAGASSDFAKLAKDAPSGYAAMAKLEQANTLLGTGHTGDAVAIYEEIERNGDSSLSAIARLRHAWAIVDLAPKADIVKLLAPLSANDSAWRYSAGEVLAYSDYHNGATPAAIAGFKKLATDTSAPENLRNRARAMQSFLESGGGRDVGAVPEPAPVKPEAAAPTAPATPTPANSQNNGTPKP